MPDEIFESNKIMKFPLVHIVIIQLQKKIPAIFSRAHSAGHPPLNNFFPRQK